MAEDRKIRTSVKIYGYTYKIVGSETSAHMQLVASIVDEKMREIHTVAPSLDSSQLAVLTAVNTVHDNLKLKERIEQLENELRKLKG